jgi:hypothetical protein
MADLIKVIVSVRDPLTLLAFLAVVLLIAFRTKTVPESLFRLVGEKIGRDRFYRLVNRTIVCGFAAFLVLAGSAVLARVLDYRTAVHAASVEQLRAELADSETDEEAAARAIAAYEKALSLSRDEGTLGEAIASLRVSLEAVPTATARETLALLYQRAGNRREAMRLADEMASDARTSGTAVDVARAARLIESVSAPARLSSQACPADAAFIGQKLRLPPGSEEFEHATQVTPCFYTPLVDIPSDQKQYYAVALRAGETMTIKMRLRGLNSSNVWIQLYGPDGGFRTETGAYYASAMTDQIEYKADSAGLAYFSLSGAVQGGVLQIAVG